MCAPDVVVEDVGAGFEVGDGAGDFEDAVVGAGRHVRAYHGVFQLFQAGGDDALADGGAGFAWSFG